MPRYSYSCTNCENKVEAFHSSDERLSFCEKCSTETLKKILFPVNTIKSNNENKSQKVGSLVNQKIEEAKQELKDYRSQIRKEAK
jgi:putative FmdB family regulatory protein